MSYEKNGQVCFKKNVGDVAFKCRGGDAGCVIFKNGRQLGAATFTISWGGENKDLDILGYWRGNESEGVGWGYAQQSAAPYFATWGGDNTAAGGSETITVQMRPWNYRGTRAYQVHFNFFGEVAADAVCNVTCAQSNKTLSLRNVPCSTRKSERAGSGDPGVEAVFNDLGELLTFKVL